MFRMRIVRTTGRLVAVLALSLSAMHGSTGTIADVQHVVIFIQENRSFDEYFGSLRGVRGFNDPNALLFQNGNSALYQPQSGGYVLPFHTTNQCLNDVDHGWAGGHTAWDSGKWDQWLPAKGTTAMTFHTRTDLAYYYALADVYTVCDAYFCSVMGPTDPNRLYSMTGMIDPNGTGGGPAIDNSAPGKPLHDRGMAFVNDLVAAFMADVTNGAMPQVSWIVAPTALSEHPIYSPSSGAALN